jgi:hypothetical protein
MLPPYLSSLPRPLGCSFSDTMSESLARIFASHLFPDIVCYPAFLLDLLRTRDLEKKISSGTPDHFSFFPDVYIDLSFSKPLNSK